MKILLLGATGKTGTLILEKATEKGHTIVAIARNPEKLKGYKADIIHGTPYDYETVEKAIAGCDAVINMLDVSRTTGSPWAKLAAPKDMISKSAGNAMKAMEKEGITRFIAMSTFGAGRSWKTSPWLLKFIVSVSNMKYAFQDLGRQEELLEQSRLDYTICRAPKLTDKENDGKYLATTGDINPLSSRLSRVTLAGFCITLIENNSHIREVINIVNNE